MSKMDSTTTTNTPPPDLHIPPSKYTVSVSIINTTSTIHGAKTSDFIGPPIKGHEWLAAPVFSFLIQHHDCDDDSDPHKSIPGKTRNLLFDLGIRKDWWNSAPSLVDCLRSIEPPWTLMTERSVWDILAGKRDDYAAGGHERSSESGPDVHETGSGRGIDARSETACDIVSGSRNNSNITTTTTASAAISSKKHGEKIITEIHSRGGEKSVGTAPNTSNIDPNTIEAIIWSHHHFDHTGDPSLFPSHTALIVGPGVKDALLPGYPDDHDSIILRNDYQGREVIELDFETGTAPSGPKDEDPKGEGEKKETRTSKTLTIGQLPAIDYFGDGSFYLLDTPGHAVGHICALARVTSSLDVGSGRQMGHPDIQDTFVLLAGDAFHHPGEIRPSRWMKVPERLSVTLAATAVGRMGTSKGILIQDVLSKKDDHLHSGANQHQGKSSDRFGYRGSISASQAASMSGLDSDSASSGSVPLVGMDIEDTGGSGIGVGVQSDITGPDRVDGGRVVGDIPVSGAYTAGAMLCSEGEDGHLQHGPQAVGDGNMSMSTVEGRAEPGGHGSMSGEHRPLEPNMNLTQMTKTSSYSTCTDGTAAEAASRIYQEVSTARGKQFTIPGKVFTALLPHFDPNRGDGFGNSSFYYPAGSPLCQSLAKHKWHHNPAQAACTLHKLQEIDAQENILVLAAHDESLLDLDSRLWFPRGTLNNWPTQGLKDKLNWQFLVDFVGAIPVGADTCRAELCDNEKEEKQAPGSTKEEKSRGGGHLEPTALRAGMSREDHHHLTLLKARWETRRDYWGPVGLEGV